MAVSDVLSRSKYAPLAEYLLSIPQQQREVALSFSEMESILGAPLPSSAHEYRPWWANQTDNENRPQARAWMSAHFIVDHVDLTNKCVMFTRPEQHRDTPVDDFGVPADTVTTPFVTAARGPGLDGGQNIVALIAAGLFGLVLGLLLGKRS